MEFYSAKNPPPRRKFFTPGPSRVVRDSLVKQECDINHIVDRYKTTGSFLNPGISPDRRLSFGDFCDVPDLMTAQNQLIAAKEAFSALPAVVRKRFNNDSFALLEFLEILIIKMRLSNLVWLMLLLRFWSQNLLRFPSVSDGGTS